MSKYDDLCAEYQQASARFNQYADYCYTFADEFFTGLKEYLDCPDDTIKFYAPQDMLDIKQGCDLKKALLHSPDGYYSLCFSLTLKNSGEQDVVLAALRIKKASDYFLVKVGLSRKEFEISAKEDFIPAFDYIYDSIKNYYQRDGFIKSTSNPIGFAV